MAYFTYPNISATVTSGSFPLLAPNGTVAAPSYSFGGGTGGAGTGLYAPAANSAAIATNGTQGFRLSSTQTATIGSDNSTTHILIGGESTINGSSLNCKVATTDAAGSFAITRFGNDGLLVLSGGGSANGNDGMIRLYGNTHATKASKVEINAAGVLALSVDASAGVTASSGDLKIGTAGKGLFVKEGSNAKMGVSTLSSGTVVVSTTAVTATSRIFLCHQTLGTITVPVGLAVSARSAGTSFTILSGNLTDTSVVAWMIVEPA